MSQSKRRVLQVKGIENEVPGAGMFQKEEWCFTAHVGQSVVGDEGEEEAEVRNCRTLRERRIKVKCKV